MGNSSKNKKQKPQKPPVSLARIAGEILAGAPGALIGGAPILYLIYQELKYGELSEWAGGVLFALPFTYPIGALISAVGVYGVGNIRNQTGSFGRSLAYSFLGLAAAVASVAGLYARPWPLWFWGSVLNAIFFAGPTLGAIIGFNMARRYKWPPGEAKKPPPAEAKKPPVNIARITAQFLAGAGAAFAPCGLVLAVSIFVSISVDEFLDMLAELHPFFITVPPLYLLFIAPALGAILVYVVGKTGNQTGSFGAALAGSILAALIGVLIGFTYLHLRPSSLFALPFVVPLGAAIGFNLTRRYKSPPAS